MFKAKFKGRDRLRDAGVQKSVRFIFVLRSLRRWKFKRASSASFGHDWSAGRFLLEALFIDSCT